MHRNGNRFARTGPPRGCASLSFGFTQAGIIFAIIRPMS